ncbi:FucU, fucose operon fucU protein [Oceanicola granulosus HTCC2516]|uniref:FucU, fucose operon fucU protein n=1 Tax=Oceanicola granulosus (strain ATCC BAA-861 / DSM 15982 / KCTC 12143 / HTCC2516) TaxID=314256 RepID=Q2CDT2_OCEGH|nr:RbsD/FucU family protein [Oceanicola granulosus]EAR50768.1 FucU, fucose operon fucU protein [Oceanicola granulosus HTCC2516]
MLRNIPPILSPDLLHALAAMGHGDDIVIADANFPGTSMGRRLLRLDGISATDTLEAVLGLLPLDSFVPDPALVMEVVDDPDAVPEIVADFQTIIDATADHPAKVARLERFAFYERAKEAFAVIQTGETRLYGNIILKKGVIG